MFYQKMILNQFQKIFTLFILLEVLLQKIKDILLISIHVVLENARHSAQNTYFQNLDTSNITKYTSPSPFIVRVILEGRRCNALIDTGASRTIVSEFMVKRLTWDKTDLSFVVGNGETMYALGTANVKIQIGKLKVKFDCVILPNQQYDLILGEDFLYAMKFNCNLNEHKAVFVFDNISHEVKLRKPRSTNTGEKFLVLASELPKFPFEELSNKELKNEFIDELEMSKLTLRLSNDIQLEPYEMKRVDCFIEGNIPEGIEHFCIHPDYRISFYKDVLLEDTELVKWKEGIRIKLKNYGDDTQIVKAETRLAEIVPLNLFQSFCILCPSDKNQVNFSRF